MKVPDVNLLLYSMEEASPYHFSAKTWLESAFNSGQGVGLVWLVLVGFLRLSTQKKVLVEPLTVAQALAVTDEWIHHPHAHILHPGVRHADILGKLLLDLGTAGNLTNDAHIAALAVEYGGTVGTFDKDFKRFTGVKINLLIDDHDHAH